MSTKKHTVSVADRLKALHSKTQSNWDEIAESLDISLSMLHQVKRGQRNLSAKALHRLVRVEEAVDLHIANQIGKTLEIFSTGGLVKDRFQDPAMSKIISDAFDEVKSEISKADLAKGYIDVPVHYRTMKPPNGWPSLVRLAKPSHHQALIYLRHLKKTDNTHSIMMGSLPTQLANDLFLDSLDPLSIHALVLASLILTFGPILGEKFYNALWGLDETKKQ